MGDLGQASSGIWQVITDSGDTRFVLTVWAPKIDATTMVKQISILAGSDQMGLDPNQIALF